MIREHQVHTDTEFSELFFHRLHQYFETICLGDHVFPKRFTILHILAIEEGIVNQFIMTVDKNYIGDWEPKQCLLDRRKRMFPILMNR